MTVGKLDESGIARIIWMTVGKLDNHRDDLDDGREAPAGRRVERAAWKSPETAPDAPAGCAVLADFRAAGACQPGLALNTV